MQIKAPTAAVRLRTHSEKLWGRVGRLLPQTPTRSAGAAIFTRGPLKIKARVRQLTSQNRLLFFRRRRRCC